MTPTYKPITDVIIVAEVMRIIVFGWPGMGRLYYEAILAADESVIVALTFMFTLLYVVARFILEILYIVLDPRVRYK